MCFNLIRSRHCSWLLSPWDFLFSRVQHVCACLFCFLFFFLLMIFWKERNFIYAWLRTFPRRLTFPPAKCVTSCLYLELSGISRVSYEFLSINIEDERNKIPMLPYMTPKAGTHYCSNVGIIAISHFRLWFTLNLWHLTGVSPCLTWFPHRIRRAINGTLLHTYPWCWRCQKKRQFSELKRLRPYTRYLRVKLNKFPSKPLIGPS